MHLPGLVNLGSTCYLNAVLQALANTPCFVRFILSTAPAPTGGPSVTTYTVLRRVLADMWLHSSASVSPYKLVEALSPLLARHGISVNEQCDAQELYCLLSDCLCEAHAGATEILRGTIQQNIICGLCGASTKQTTAFTTLDVYLGCGGGEEEEEHDDVTSLIRKSFAQEQILDWSCDSCKSKRLVGCSRCSRCSAFTSRGIWSTPSMLVVCIRRATGLNACDLIRKEIIIDQCIPSTVLSGLSASDSPASSRKQLFDLSAVVTHCGSRHSGHYATFIRLHLDAGDIQWVLYDDETATPMKDLPRWVSHCVYMLFYSRILI